MEEASQLLIEMRKKEEELFLMRLSLAGSDAERGRKWQANSDLAETITYYSDESKHKGGN